MLRAALPFRDSFIGVGLDSAEVGHPPRLFRTAYEIAAAEGLHRVAHAGEEGGPDYVAEALDVLGVERIDHGIRALEDPALVDRLREERIPLTVCPLSNVALRAVDRIEDHPLRTMLELGLVATLNSDDPAYFGGGIDANVAAVRAFLGLTDAELAVLAANSFEAAFVGDARPDDVARRGRRLGPGRRARLTRTRDIPAAQRPSGGRLRACTPTAGPRPCSSRRSTRSVACSRL